MSFKPVFLPAERALNGRVSQTMLRHANLCMRSGYLYALTKGDVRNVAMQRGMILHLVAERGTKIMLEQGEPMLPPEIAKDLVSEVLVEHPLPVEEHDYVREAAFRWAEQFTVDPAAVVACETLLTLDVDGYQVRCKVDFAELQDNGRALNIVDLKTGRGAPPYEKIGRKRADGTIAAKAFQLVLYAVALVYGRPVRVEMERCLNCESTPERPDMCVSCAGSGFTRNEHVEPFPLAPHAQEAILSFVYPGVEIKTGQDAGQMLRQPLGLTRMEIDAYRESIAAIVAGVRHAEESGDWPATVSDDGCAECPCSARCPIPGELRDHRGEINSMEELVEAAEVYYRRSQELKADRREIKASAKAYGGPSARVRFGRDRVWELGDVRESTTIDDRDGLFEAVERALQYGEPFDRVQFVKTTKSTPFSERALSEEELEAEAAEREAV